MEICTKFSVQLYLFNRLGHPFHPLQENKNELNKKKRKNKKKKKKKKQKKKTKKNMFFLLKKTRFKKNCFFHNPKYWQEFYV